MRLYEKQRNEPPVKLTCAEKREIQTSIPHQAMYPDGICGVTANTFSKCIEFADISYQLAQADNLKMARARLTRIETDLLGYFKTMGSWLMC